MNEEPMPGTSAADQELGRRWRRQSLEEPSSSTDARIRAAARQAIASSAPYGSREARHRSRWTRRFMPLAAAASVALLAVGLVRLIPREQYQAVPRPELARPGETPEPDPAARSKQDSAPDTERPAGGQLYAIPSAPESRDEAEGATARTLATAPDSDLTPRQPVEAVTAEEVRSATPTEAAAHDHPSVEQAAKAREQAREAQAPDTAIAPTGIPAAAAPSASPRMDSAFRSAIPATLAVQVQNHAARRTGLDPESIRIVAVDPVARPDTSLGCETALASVPEARVLGYVVTVDAGGTTLRYHTDGRDQVRVCDGK